MIHEMKIDGAVGAASIAAPWWLQLFNEGMHVVVVIGGAVLLALRIALAVREWRRRR